MICTEYKLGNGTSSRIIKTSKIEKEYIIGCLVLSNFGQMKDLLKHKIFTQKNKENKSNIELEGSIMIILATNAPLNERQLKRLAKRAGIGLGNSGSHIDHGSGDIVIRSEEHTSELQSRGHLVCR